MLNAISSVAGCFPVWYIGADFQCLEFVPGAPTPPGWFECAGPGLDSGRVDVSEPASISSGIAQRYATAILEILQENNDLNGLETSVDSLAEALNSSDDLRDLINSPVVSRDDQDAAITAIAAKMDLVEGMRNALSLMAQKRRLFILPQLIEQLRDMIADHKGEVTAEVVSAKALTKGQTDKLATALKARVGKDVKINAAVDKDIIGGLIVKVGSKMIDTSIRSKLSSLQNAMKEVG